MNEEAWDKQFSNFLQFVIEYRSSNDLPTAYKSRKWVYVGHREFYRNDELSQRRIKKIETNHDWKWLKKTTSSKA